MTPLAVYSPTRESVTIIAEDGWLEVTAAGALDFAESIDRVRSRLPAFFNPDLAVLRLSRGDERVTIKASEIEPLADGMRAAFAIPALARALVAEAA